jgi:LmbE family N-acetylglucosaminyl deacetylase
MEATLFTEKKDSVYNKKILVVVAHPDDAESFCGSTLAKLSKQGNFITLLVCTNGDRGSHDRRIVPIELFATRKKEQEVARTILGIQDVIWLGYRDGTLANMPDLCERLIRVIRQIQPEIILTFDPWKHYEFHPDHRAVGFITTQARMLADLPWIYPELTLEDLQPWHAEEVYLFAPQDANYWVDIQETLELKVNARLVHESQNDFIQCSNDQEDFIEQIRAKAREEGKSSGYAYGEAFHKVDGTDLFL